MEIRFEYRDSELPPGVPNISSAPRWQNPLTLHTTAASRFFALSAVAVNMATGSVSAPRVLKLRVADDFCLSSELPSNQPCRATTTLATDVSAAVSVPAEVQGTSAIDVTFESMPEADWRAWNFPGNVNSPVCVCVCV